MKYYSPKVSVTPILKPNQVDSKPYGKIKKEKYPRNT